MEAIAGRRVLVVEEEMLLRMLLAEMLGEIGCEIVAETGSLDEAMTLARDANFDVAILDVMMNGRSGLSGGRDRERARIAVRVRDRPRGQRATRALSRPTAPEEAVRHRGRHAGHGGRIARLTGLPGNTGLSCGP
jgi:chemotaxis response regulator CheB